MQRCLIHGPFRRARGFVGLRLYVMSILYASCILYRMCSLCNVNIVCIMHPIYIKFFCCSLDRMCSLCKMCSLDRMCSLTRMPLPSLTRRAPGQVCGLCHPLRAGACVWAGGCLRACGQQRDLHQEFPKSPLYLVALHSIYTGALKVEKCLSVRW